VNGIHEVRGSIPLSSTIQINNLENGQSGENAGLSISCPFFRDNNRRNAAQEVACVSIEASRNPYDSTRVGQGRMSGVDFTDCPYTALTFATARRASVLVVEMPADSPKVTEELWHPGAAARRLMLWGRFDAHLVAAIPAKELRAQVRRKGIISSSRTHKAEVLRGYMQDRLSGEQRPWQAHEELLA
jgi:hypothetical protein